MNNLPLLSQSQNLCLVAKNVYRALLKKRWINEDTGKVEAGAYFMREKEKDRGLSVNIAATCSPQQCAEKFDKCFGVASLHVGRIREHHPLLEHLQLFDDLHTQLIELL